eukprot:TRINITY_DN674_c1_g3_i1.p1 TRINITY_DN674_c1_g3~~TRINITY_DN674_c1_g3_i1.p1  ORF type:complete len:796 (+),score=195.74 TRINITY_DN674_c1_g3_i1:64-2388(+)
MLRGKKKKEKVSIYSAARKGDIQSLTALSTKKDWKQQVNSQDKLGRYPLHLAAGKGHTEAVKFLLDHGADIEVEDPEAKWNVLHFAAESTNPVLFSMLVNRKGIEPVVRLSNKDRNSPVHYFCRKFAKDTEGSLDVMFGKGASVNSVNYNGETALHQAAWKGRLALCTILTKHGADVDAQNDRGESPLHWAARAGFVTVSRMLIKAGANYSLQGENGTPLDVAKADVSEMIEAYLSENKNHPQAGQLSRTDKSSAISLTDLRQQNGPLKWEIPLQDIQMGEVIGKGGMGIVSKGVWKGLEVAIKKVLDAKILTEPKMFEDFLKEINLMSKLKHPNVLLLLGASLDNGVMYVTEYMSKGDLLSVLKSEPKLPWDTKLNIALESSKGLAYLHNLNPVILHHDLKSLNLLLDSNYHVKIADFGMSMMKSDKSATMIGSLAWASPEVVSGEQYTEKSDVFSFGRVLWELVSHTPPFAGKNELFIISSIVENRHPPWSDSTPSAYVDLVQSMWAELPADRPEIFEIVDSLRDLKSNHLEQLTQNEGPKTIRRSIKRSTSDDLARSTGSRNASRNSDEEKKPVLRRNRSDGELNTSSSTSNQEPGKRRHPETEVRGEILVLPLTRKASSTSAPRKHKRKPPNTSPTLSTTSSSADVVPPSHNSEGVNGDEEETQHSTSVVHSDSYPRRKLRKNHRSAKSSMLGESAPAFPISSSLIESSPSHSSNTSSQHSAHSAPSSRSSALASSSTTNKTKANRRKSRGHRKKHRKSTDPTPSSKDAS